MLLVFDNLRFLNTALTFTLIELLYIFLTKRLLFAISKLPVVKKQHQNEAIGHGRHQKLVNGT